MKNSKKIKALGFVEVIIAIVVVGIISAVFLTMSGRAMKELVQTERIEYMGRVAKNGVNIAQEVANLQKGALSNEGYFPTVEGRCYIPVKDETDYYYFEPDDTPFDSFDPDDRNTVLSAAIYNDLNGDPTDYFLLMCIDSIDSTKWANVYFWVGDIHVAGQQTSDTDMKDLKYYAIIDL